MGERHRAESRFHVKRVVEKEAHDALSSGGLGGGASRAPAASRLGRRAPRLCCGPWGPCGVSGRVCPRPGHLGCGAGRAGRGACAKGRDHINLITRQYTFYLFEFYLYW